MNLENHAETIFNAGLTRVHSRKLLEQVLNLDGNILKIKTENEELSIDLSKFSKIKMIGFGKAAAQMAAGLTSVLGTNLQEGIVIVKDPTEVILPAGFEILQGSHPLPGQASLDAGKKLVEYCKNCQEGELVLGVISGGASALIELPAEGLNLQDLQKTTELLMASGATIHEMNSIRKHLSKIKGGRLAREIFPAASVNFILSDVVGDDLTVIGSGPTVADNTTFSDAWRVVEKYSLASKLPMNISEYLKVGMDETPKNGDLKLSGTRNILVGTNRQALTAARKKAQELGYDTLILSHELQGEASLVAHKLYTFSKEMKQNPKFKKPACILAGGETTVTLNGSGKGGRNQEMALAYVCCLMDQTTDSLEQIFLSASTDGSDGPTDAAGAFASMKILESAKKLGLNPEEFLDNNDSYHFFDKAGGLLKTGPTETNVCDLQVLLIR
jgi:hydroxypyruvate reductase